MTSNTRKDLEKAITSEENRDIRKNYKALPYTFDDVDSDLSREKSTLSGDRARLASRDAWVLLNTRR